MDLLSFLHMRLIHASVIFTYFVPEQRIFFLDQLEINEKQI